MSESFLLFDDQNKVYTVPKLKVNTRQGWKKSKFSHCSAEISVYSKDKSKDFLLNKHLKIFLPGHADQ